MFKAVFPEISPGEKSYIQQRDVVKSKDNVRMIIQSMEEKSGIIIYHGDGISISETELAETISFSGPKERLCGGYADSIDAFNFRYKLLETRCRHKKSKSFGFTGCRVDLIRHQIYSFVKQLSQNVKSMLLLSARFFLSAKQRKKPLP